MHCHFCYVPQNQGFQLGKLQNLCHAFAVEKKDGLHFCKDNTSSDLSSKVKHGNGKNGKKSARLAVSSENQNARKKEKEKYCSMIAL